jgi:asparagine synthase (glutamine-hydrolysing)
MCGIAAIIAQPGHVVPLDLPGIFSRELAHRGPDAEGLASFTRGGVACTPDRAEISLVHRRLAIIDLDPRSNQPMISADERYVLIYNGEIYNYVELRAELERAGHIFRTQSDSEVLLTAYSVWGEKALARFTGMFAFAILDREKRELFVARDPFGIKPLFWSISQKMVAFASEIGPLLKVPGVDKGANLSRLFLYLSTGQTNAGADTMFAGVQSLPAGSYARISCENPNAPLPVLYWAPCIAPRERPFAEAASELRDAFLESIQLHLRSDVPVGVALSGGIDSSAIVAGARHVGGNDLAIHTFSFTAAGSDVDETPYIDIAASSAKAESTRLCLQPQEIISDIDRLIVQQGEPFGSLSIYAQHRVMQLAAQNGIKVMLDGQGADELFAGYRPYLARRLSELLGSFRLGSAAQLASSMRGLPQYQLSQFAQALEPFTPHALRPAMRSLVGRPLVPSWIDQGWFEKGAISSGIPEALPSSPLLHSALVQSLTNTILPALLRYEDCNSMAFSIESRVPFLTTRLADLAYSMPSSHLIDNQARSKAVLRAALQDIVPDAILNRRDKIGFATPDSLWMGSLRPWFESVLTGDKARSLKWLRPDVLSQTLKGRADRSSAFGFDIWRVINVIRWAEIFNVELQ